ncbi:MAG: hypothetical protein RLO12_00925 [Fulvivirga sp.]
MSKQSQHILLIVTFGLIANLTILYLLGERANLYDANGYIKGADYLINHGSYEDFHHVFYGLHVAIIALGRLFFPDQIIQIIIFQIILSLFSMVALYQSINKLFENKTAVLISCLIFIFWWDCIHWNTTLMSESLFCSLTIFIVYILAHFQGGKMDFVKLGILLFAISFTRPTSLVILVGVIVFFPFYYKEPLKQLSVVRKTILSLSFILLSLLGAALMFQKWDFTDAYIKGEVVTYMSTIPDSPLYKEELHVPLKNTENEVMESELGIIRMAKFMVGHPGYFFTMALKKVYYLLSFQRPYYSVWHNTYSAIWLALIYGCFVIGYLKCSHSPIKAFVISVIVINCALIGMSTVDWDNRFFIPMEPGIVHFAGYGAYKFLAKLKCYINMKGYFNLLN